jgi:hypothetical protein
MDRLQWLAGEGQLDVDLLWTPFVLVTGLPARKLLDSQDGRPAESQSESAALVSPPPHYHYSNWID